MQLSIFEAPPIDYSRGRHNELSKEAFEKVKPHINATHAKILELIDGNLCTYEIAVMLGKELHKISGRFGELEKMHKIQFVGKKNINGSNYSIYKKL